MHTLIVCMHRRGVVVYTYGIYWIDISNFTTSIMSSQNLNEKISNTDLNGNFIQI